MEKYMGQCMTEAVDKLLNRGELPEEMTVIIVVCAAVIVLHPDSVWQNRRFYSIVKKDTAMVSVIFCWKAVRIYPILRTKLLILLEQFGVGFTMRKLFWHWENIQMQRISIGWLLVPEYI